MEKFLGVWLILYPYNLDNQILITWPNILSYDKKNSSVLFRKQNYFSSDKSDPADFVWQDWEDFKKQKQFKLKIFKVSENFWVHRGRLAIENPYC